MTCEVLTTLNKRYKPFHKLFDSFLAFVLAIKTEKTDVYFWVLPRATKFDLIIRLRSIPVSFCADKKTIPYRFTHKKGDFGVISVQLSKSPGKVFRELKQQ